MIQLFVLLTVISISSATTLLSCQEYDCIRAEAVLKRSQTTKETLDMMDDHLLLVELRARSAVSDSYSFTLGRNIARRNETIKTLSSELEMYKLRLREALPHCIKDLRAQVRVTEIRLRQAQQLASTSSKNFREVLHDLNSTITDLRELRSALRRYIRLRELDKSF